MQEQTIKLRHDGSIDTAYYMQRGRRLRSEAAHEMAKGLRVNARTENSRQAGWQSLWARKGVAAG